jgi:hypothetical protein
MNIRIFGNYVVFFEEGYYSVGYKLKEQDSDCIYNAYLQYMIFKSEHNLKK